MQLEAGGQEGDSGEGALCFCSCLSGSVPANPGLGLGNCPVTSFQFSNVTYNKTTWWRVVVVRVTLLVRDCIETRTQVSLPHVPSA